MRRFYWWMATANIFGFTLMFLAGMWQAYQGDYAHACYDSIIAGFNMYWHDYFMTKC